jgi:type I restriction enzyme M protein
VDVQSEYIEPLCDAMVIGKLAYERAQAIAVSLERHKTLEEDVKAQKSIIKANADKRDLLVESARAKITQEEARKIIIERLHKTLIDTYKTYLRAEQRACIAAIENLWKKYAVTAKTIEAERDAAAKELQALKDKNFINNPIWAHKPPSCNMLNNHSGKFNVEFL